MRFPSSLRIILFSCLWDFCLQKTLSDTDEKKFFESLSVDQIVDFRVNMSTTDNHMASTDGDTWVSAQILSVSSPPGFVRVKPMDDSSGEQWLPVNDGRVAPEGTRVSDPVEFRSVSCFGLLFLFSREVLAWRLHGIFSATNFINMSVRVWSVWVSPGADSTTVRSPIAVRDVCPCVFVCVHVHAPVAQQSFVPVRISFTISFFFTCTFGACETFIKL